MTMAVVGELSHSFVCMQTVCGLTNLQHLKLRNGYYPYKPADVGAMPAAVSRLQSLRSLQVTGHDTLRALPPELYTLTRCMLPATE